MKTVNVSKIVAGAMGIFSVKGAYHVTGLERNPAYNLCGVYIEHDTKGEDRACTFWFDNEGDLVDSEGCTFSEAFEDALADWINTQ